MKQRRKTSRSGILGEELEPRRFLSAVAFAAHQVGEPGLAIDAADLDGDGDVDVLATYFGGDTESIGWHENTDGRGTFGQLRILDNFSFIKRRTLYAADVDGDNDVDVVLSTGCGICYYDELSC